MDSELKYGAGRILKICWSLALHGGIYVNNRSKNKKIFIVGFTGLIKGFQMTTFGHPSSSHTMLIGDYSVLDLLPVVDKKDQGGDQFLRPGRDAKLPL